MATAVAPRPVSTVQRRPDAAAPLLALKQAVEAESQRRAIIQNFVNSQLKEDVDYGSIKVNGRDAKPTLFKPGMEKVFSLFDIVSKLEKDEETLSMISNKDVIAYKCELYRNGQFVGEGRGACGLSEKGRVNDAIKIAEKRARMDACLNLGFSEYFTQDLDDLKQDPIKEREPAAPKARSFAGETETLEFTVIEKTELSSGKGNPYARLKTDKGTVIAFKNTMASFSEGSAYLAGGVWEERNGNAAFVITAPASQIVNASALEFEAPRP